MPTSPYDLTTVANVKIWTNATVSTTDDVTLQRLVTSVSMQIINVLGRNPFLNMVMEYRNGNGNSQLFVRKFPIARFLGVTFLGGYNTGVSSFFGGMVNIPFAGSGSQYGYTYTDTLVTLFGARFPQGLGNVRLNYIGGYCDTAFETVTLSSDTYPVENSGTFIDNVGVYYANGTPLVYTASPTPSVGQYTFSYGNLVMFNVQGGGVYKFNAADVGSGVVIAYRYGKIPADLEQIAIEAVSFLSMRRKSIGQTTSNAGGQRTTYINAELPPETLGKLSNFESKVPVV